MRSLGCTSGMGRRCGGRIVGRDAGEAHQLLPCGHGVALLREHEYGEREIAQALDIGYRHGVGARRGIVSP